MEATLNIYDLFQKMSQNRILLIYRGALNQDMIKSVVSMTEIKLIREQADETVRKKLFNVMIEGLQNICKHQIKSDDDSHSPFLIINRAGDSFSLITGNMIENTKIAFLSEKLDFINSLDKDALKEHYKHARLNSVISEVGGAGLGFIDMVRKSGNKLDYKFYDIDHTFSFFILITKINNN